METKESIKKGIIFLKGFNSLSDKEMYRKAVLRFVSLVEKYVDEEKDLVEVAQEIFEK